MWLILGDKSGFGSNNYFSSDGKSFRRLVQLGYGNGEFAFLEPVTSWVARAKLPQPGFDFIQITEGLATDKPIFRPTNSPTNYVLHDFPEEEVVEFFGTGFEYFFLLTQMKYGEQYALYAGSDASCLKKLDCTDSWNGQTVRLTTEIGEFEKRGNICFFEGCKITRLNDNKYQFTFSENSVRADEK
jgi:hypothetical protein